MHSLFGADILPAQKSGWGIEVSNLSKVTATDAAITVTVSPRVLNATAAQVSFDSTKNELTINGVVFALTNPNYTFSIVNGKDLQFVSKPGHILLAGNKEVIGLEIIKSPNNTTATDGLYDIYISGGGETRTDNNTTLQYFQYDEDLDYVSSKIAFNNNISVYPNPAQSVLNIKATNDQNIIGLQILDNAGRTLQSIKGYVNIIQTENLFNGYYILRIVNKYGQINHIQFTISK